MRQAEKEKRANDPEYAEKARLAGNAYAKAYRDCNIEHVKKLERAKYGRRSKEGNNAYMREWNAKNKDRLNAAKRLRRANDPEYAARLRTREKENSAPQKLRRRRLKREYGMKPEDYDALYEKQGGKCGICERVHVKYGRLGLVIDHCHTSNNVRELLCPQCNQALGKFKDSVELLQNAISYLMKHSTE